MNQVRNLKKKCRIGLISDTHMPERWPKLPGAIFDLFEDVELILHAGDVGKLWVLDELSRLAPVLAVHGNDETREASEALPYVQTISIEGIRVLLCHSHYRNRDLEMESRKTDDWGPMLERRREQARAVGATVFVFGHLHIPMTYQFDDVLLINPGAIASGNAHSLQKVQTVAILEIGANGQISLTHIDLKNPSTIYVPLIDWEGGYRNATPTYIRSILSPAIENKMKAVQYSQFARSKPVKQAVLRVSHRCWAGQQSEMGKEDLLAEIDGDPEILEEDKHKIVEILK